MKKQLAGSVVLGLILMTGAHGAPETSVTAGANGNKQITVRVRNYTQLGSGVLVKAERVSASIFREAGVDVVWITCPTNHKGSGEGSCTIQRGPLDLILNILPRSMSERLPLRGEEFGFAAIEYAGERFPFFASVFYDDVKDCEMRRQQGPAHLLGTVIAHELGHLLLGANSHSSTGLMRANWSGKELFAVDRSDLSFSSSECQRLQQAVIARRQSATGSTQAQTPIMREQ